MDLYKRNEVEYKSILYDIIIIMTFYKMSELNGYQMHKCVQRGFWFQL